MKAHPCLVLVLVLVAACQSGPATAPRGDDVARGRMLDTVKSLAGRWETTGPDGTKAYFDISPTAGGSAVREVMFPGTPHEMTNMYHLDGGSLVMTHYCAGGNQPRMRAQPGAPGKLEFRFDSVTDLASADAVYMGEMTLVVEDADHVRQEWRALRGKALDHETVFRLERVR
jgi:hypothetical protein